MDPDGISPHEPAEELIGPPELVTSVANLERAMVHSQLGSLMREAETDSRISHLLRSLMGTGVGRNEKEVIARALETLFVAVAPQAERERLLSP